MYSNGWPILLYAVSLTTPLDSPPPNYPTQLTSSLPAVTINFLLFLCLCLCMWATLYIQVSACMCGVCVSIIECPCCWQAFSQSHISVVYVVFPADPLFPPNSSHLSFLLFFHFHSVLLLSPSHVPSSFHIFICVSFLSSCYSLLLSPSFLISPSCTFVSFHLSLCSVGWFVFAASYFFPCFLHPIFTLLSPVYFCPFLFPSQLLALWFFLLFCSPPFSHVADLFLQGFSLSAFFLFHLIFTLLSFSLSMPLPIPFICTSPIVSPSHTLPLCLILAPSIALYGNHLLICRFLVPHSSNMLAPP